MEIIIGKTSGFCFGVKNAVDKAEEQTKNGETVYCLGELVHNKQVVEDLTSKGIKFINNIGEAVNKVIIRAHGTVREDYETAKKNDIEIIDLTCPKVINIHNIAIKYASQDYFILLIGKKNHPEIVATKTFCGEYSTIVEEKEEINDAISEFLLSKKKKMVILPQTTYNLNKFNEIIQTIQERLVNIEIEVKNTICNATKDRQEETIELSKKVNAMIIVGGKHSSNTIELYESARKFCKNTQFIENSNEIDLNKFKGVEKVGIMAGASTPEKSVKELVEILQEI